MAYSQATGSWLLAGALSACTLGCEAQASERYLGEPLLQLHGSAIVTADTGGEAVKPALCFQKGAARRMPHSVESLPSEVREVLEYQIEIGEKLDALADTDEAAMWMPNQLVQIVEVESVGRFPSEFNVEAYLPPSDEFVQPLFEDEPALAEGYLCAVRDGHPDVVNAPQLYQGTHCENGNDGPCDMYYVFLSHDTDAYLVQKYHCPSKDSTDAECEQTIQGDAAVRRNLGGSFIEGRAQPMVVYLAQPAKPDSYTAWKYASPEGLSAGFHLFLGPPLSDFAQIAEGVQCRIETSMDARNQVRDEHADRVHVVDLDGVQTVDNIELDPTLRDAFERRAAELNMQRCSLPMLQPVSHTEPLEVRFSNPALIKLP